MLFGVLLCLCSAVFADDALDFSRDVLPILSNNCFTCHGQDAKSDQTGLRLDSFDAATKKDDDGNAAIVPGKPDKSILIERINSTDPDLMMPPATSNHTLKPEQKSCSPIGLSAEQITNRIGHTSPRYERNCQA